MYGSVSGASVTASSIAVLPSTGGSKLYLALSLAFLTVGIAITAVTVARTLAAKAFSN